MDNLMQHINKEMSGIKVRYATATEYFESLYEYQQKNEINFPVVQQDFVPYADNEDSYWTGYYTSLPNLKKRAREAEAALQNAENAFILAKLYKSKRGDNLEWQNLFSRLQTSREDTALVNHHDGITGTCRSHVYQDYMSRLSNSISASKSLERELLTVLLSSGDDPITVSDPNSILETDTDIIVHNSEGHSRYDLVSIKSHSANARIIDLTTGAEVPSMKIANLLTNNHHLAQTGAEYNYYWVHFFVSVKALSLKKYQIKFDGTDQAAQSSLYCTACPQNIREILPRPQRLQETQVSNDFYTIYFGENGLITAINDKKSDKFHKFGPQFMEYKTRRSGSYIFRPEGAGPEPITADSALAVFVTEGTLLTEVIVVTTRFTITYRLYEEWIDSHFDVHPLPADTELVTKFYADINTQSKLIVYDGINFVKRVVSDKAPHAGHYFPSTAGAIITDKKSQLTVLTAQTMGVTKVENAIQFMIHRRLQQDDGRGMAQANNDESALKGVRFLLSYQDTKQSTRFVHLARSSIDINRPISVSTMAVSKTIELVEPVSNLDEDLEIISFQSRELYSDDVVLRIRNMNPSKAQVYHPGRTFHGELESIRGKSLSLAFDVPNNARNIHPYRMQFRAAGTVSFDFTLVSATVGKDGANQNSDEEGVFLSDEALAEAKKNQGRTLKGMDDWVYKFEPFEMKTFLLDLKMEDLKQLGAPIADAQQQKPKVIAKLTKPPAKPKQPVIDVHVQPKHGDADSEHHVENEFVDIDSVLQNDPQVRKDQNQPLHPNSLLQDEEYHLWGSYTFVLLLSVLGFCSLTYCFRKGSKKLLAKLLKTSTASPTAPKETPILPYEVVSDSNKEH
jgi:alpha-mannosidase II